MKKHDPADRTTFVPRKIALAFIIVLIVVTLGAEVRPLLAQTETGNAIWNEPVNLSESGSASRPAIATEPDGRIHVLWWDKFDGTKYTFTRKDGTWTDPVTISVIVGQRQRTPTGISISPPEDLTLIADGDGLVHAFWRSSVGDLMYARVNSGSAGWSSAVRLVTAPLTWNVFLASDTSLNLAFIRSSTVASTVPGVYFRRAVGGSSWSEPTSISESLYFRTQSAADANISVISDGKKTVLVAWNDPVTGESKLARSVTSGTRFSEPESVEGGSLIEAAIPRYTRFVSLPDGGFLRLWEAGASCVLYEQTLGADNTWSPPTRVLEQLNGCLRAKRVYQVSDNRIFMMVGAAGSFDTMVAWDGLGWSAPVAPQANFLSPANEFISLSCINLSIVKDSVVLLGCDQKGDIWLLTSQVTLSEFMPTVSSAWSWPVLLSNGDNDVDMPNVAADYVGRWHLLWGQLPGAGIAGDILMYRRGDADNWSDTAVVQQISSGNVDSPALVVDPNDIVHAVWSGGDTGTILYSKAFAKDALVASDWAEPIPIPAPQPVGASPNILLSKSGKLHVVYTVPFNEDRGVYYSSSSDLGVSWSAPVKVFDAASAGWIVVPETQLAIDNQEHLYISWSRASIPNQKSPAGVYFSKSLDNGTTWSTPLEISAAADDHPYLVVTSENTLHLVWARTISGGYELWHVWSPDGGDNWSPPVRIPGIGSVSPNISLVADAAGSIHLVGIEATREGTAGIFYARWNGNEWTDRDSVRLAHSFVEGLGVRAALSSTGKLGVFYRIQVPTASGGVHYAIAYIGRQLLADEGIAPAATFTPRPLPTQLPAATAEPTITPLPVVDLNAAPTTGGNTQLLQIGLVGAAMLVVSVVAVARLLNKMRR